MLRSDHVRAVNFLRHAKRSLGLGQLPRGYLDMDAAGFAASGYAFPDDAHVGTAMGLRIQRSDALDNNHIDYLDELGTTTIDTTLLIAAAGAFTAVNWTYTENGECGVFAVGGGELINITGSVNNGNNGTFLSSSAGANTVVLTPLPGESTDIVDEAAVATSVFI